MTYGLFNLESGNLIDSAKTEAHAYAAVAEILAAEPDSEDVLGLVVLDDRGDTVATYRGRDLAAMAWASSSAVN